ncbi:DUF2087 domain-containing protein [Mycetocola lacteus]|uniref:DUF2087 domain-containing protein n=1 Tax=Mycetocola lacteus TaxID=76637 RepID=A0A3L7AQS1_9MICO|nr:DUF2087 domain-containing protein [Mycetocola lacteus]RLP82806.1 DUF2087 domain-containing protein [Mycetocola lacteus]
MSSSADWRPLLALLANDTTREVWAHLIVGGQEALGASPIPPQRAERALTALERAGLLDRSTEPWTQHPEVFAAALSRATPSTPVGIERFLNDGRILAFPVRPDERRELLELVVARTFEPGIDLTEPEVNERLGAWSSDVALLRRYLVDHGLLERDPAGAHYRLPGAPSSPRPPVGPALG